MFKKKYCFDSFTVEEIMEIAEYGATMKQLALVALTQTVGESVNNKKEGKILRKMLDNYNSIVDGFEGINSKREAEIKRLNEKAKE